MNLNNGHLGSQLKHVLMMNQGLITAMENGKKGSKTTKKTKVVKKKRVEANSQNTEQEKVYEPDKERQKQFEKVEALHHQKPSSKEEEIIRLRLFG